MLNWLVQTFIPDYNETARVSVRSSYGRLAGIIGIMCNLMLCVAKGAIGWVSGSVSIVADAVNNLSDASSNIISLVGFKLASRPADSGHPYGHGRFEYLAGLVVSMVVVAIGVQLGKTSIEKIIHPEPVEFSVVMAVVLVLSIGVKLWMAHMNRFLGDRIDSETLRATAVDSRNDVISTSAVLLCAIISSTTGCNLDGWVGLGVGIFILWSGVVLVKDTVDPLLGSAPDPRLVERIRTRILSYPGVLGTHDLMVHDYGPGRQFASAHVEMAAETDPMESHDLLDNIEQDLKDEEGIIATLHYDPIVTDDPNVRDMRNWIAACVAERIDPRVTIHDVRCVPGPTHVNVIFDCVRPSDLPLDAQQLTRRIAQEVHTHYPRAVCKITVDESYVSAQQ